MKFCYNMSCTLHKQSQDLDLSYKTDLDFWDCFGRKQLRLITEEIWYTCCMNAEESTGTKVAKLLTDWLLVYKTLFSCSSQLSIKFHMLISIKISRKATFLGSGKPRMLFFPLINVQMPTIVGILTFMSRKIFMLS